MLKLLDISRLLKCQVNDQPDMEQERTLQEEKEDKASQFTLPPGIATSSWNKSAERVVKPGGVHDEEISFLERTLRFGLFCVAVMYFRAKWLLAQQRQGVASFKLGWAIDIGVSARAQRRALTALSVNSMQAGYQRVKVGDILVITTKVPVQTMVPEYV